MGELQGFVGLLVFSVGFFAAFFRFERVVSSLRDSLELSASTGTSVPGFHMPPLRGWILTILFPWFYLRGGGFHVPRRLKPRFYSSRNAALKCCFTQNRFFLWACKTGPDFLAGLKGEPLIRG